MEEHEHYGDVVTENDEHVAYIPVRDRVMEAIARFHYWENDERNFILNVSCFYVFAYISVCL